MTETSDTDWTAPTSKYEDLIPSSRFSEGSESSKNLDERTLTEKTSESTALFSVTGRRVRLSSRADRVQNSATSCIWQADILREWSADSGRLQVRRVDQEEHHVCDPTREPVHQWQLRFWRSGCQWKVHPGHKVMLQLLQRFQRAQRFCVSFDGCWVGAFVKVCLCCISAKRGTDLIREQRISKSISLLTERKTHNHNCPINQIWSHSRPFKLNVFLFYQTFSLSLSLSLSFIHFFA